MQKLMEKDRLCAFSDGVLAIIVTIMVLDLKRPEGVGLADLLALWPVFACYVLSFVYVAIYWNNHHHMFQTVERVSGGILWANMHLLFWLSVIPFATAWMGENHLAPLPTAVYGMALLMPSLAYFILQGVIIARQGEHSLLARAVGRDWKGKASPPLYALGVVVSFWQPALAALIYVGMALVWLVPDKRIERVLGEG